MTAGVAYPADYSALYSGPQYTANQGRAALAAAMAGATSTRPLGGISGVRPGTPATTVTATSTTWTATAFGGYIDTAASATNGGYYFSFPSGGTGSVTAAAASSRIDIIYVQLSDTNTGDGTTVAPKVDVLYLAGTAGSGVPPATPARSFVVAQLNVPATGGGSPTVTWVAPYASAAGGILPVQAGSYPASSYPGQYIDDPSIGLMRSNGVSFKPYGANSTSVVPTVLGTGAVANATGLVILTSCSAASLNGLAGFRKVRIELEVTAASANNQAKLLLRSSSADDTSSNYDWQGIFASNTTISGVQSSAQAAWSGMASSDAQTYSLWIEIEDLDQARMTRATGETDVFSTSGPPRKGALSFSHRSATPWDGVTIAASTGTITGTVRVLGIA